jgi:ubiquinone/menaquinone biosynthesis C-methylase UbiE/uncharacterized protein YbaR (Trm112 family)
MQTTLLNMLQCPVCKKGNVRLMAASKKQMIPVNDVPREFIMDGLLGCTQCPALFPVINHVATLLPEDMMTETEKTALRMAGPNRRTETVEYGSLPVEERHARMRAFLHQYPFYREETYPDEKSKAWIRNSVAYEVEQAILKDKYVRSASRMIRKPPKTMLDIGGGQGGTLFCFKQHFKPDCAVLLDLDDRFTPIAQLRDETINVIRADATHMPFKNKAFDLTISNGCLEHVKQWPGMLGEIRRTGFETYLSYIPNGAFPWEIGHLSAPLVTWLPKTMARRVCFFWHKLLNNRQYTYELIDHLLDITNFVPSRRFAAECKRRGIRATNMFYFYTLEASRASYHHTYGKYVRFLGDHPLVLRLFTSAAMALHMEPVVHYYLYHPE